MKTTILTTSGAIPRKLQILSRFHPRLKKALASNTQVTPPAQRPVAAPLVPLAVAPRIAPRKPRAQVASEFAKRQKFIPRRPAPKALPAEDPEGTLGDEPVAVRKRLTPMHCAIFVAVLILGFLLTFWYGRSLGHDEAVRLTKHSEVSPHPKLPSEAVKPFENTLTELRQDKPLGALAELQKGNFSDAAAILRASQKSLSPDLFSYLINDPERRRFSRQPELAGLF